MARATPFAEYDGMKVAVDVAPTGQRPALRLRAGLGRPRGGRGRGVQALLQELLQALFAGPGDV